MRRPGARSCLALLAAVTAALLTPAATPAATVIGSNLTATGDSVYALQGSRIFVYGDDGSAGTLATAPAEGQVTSFRLRHNGAAADQGGFQLVILTPQDVPASPNPNDTCSSPGNYFTVRRVGPLTSYAAKDSGNHPVQTVAIDPPVAIHTGERVGIYQSAPSGPPTQPVLTASVTGGSLWETGNDAATAAADTNACPFDDHELMLQVTIDGDSGPPPPPPPTVTNALDPGTGIFEPIGSSAVVRLSAGRYLIRVRQDYGTQAESVASRLYTVAPPVSSASTGRHAVLPASKPKGRTFTATGSFAWTTLTHGKSSYTADGGGHLAGLELRGSLTAKLTGKKKAVKGAPAGLRDLLRSVLVTHIDATRYPSATGQSPLGAAGIMVGHSKAHPKTLACLSVAVDGRTGHEADNRLTLLGGTGTVAGMRMTATFPGIVLGQTIPNVHTDLQVSTGKPRGLSKSCKALLKKVGH